MASKVESKQETAAKDGADKVAKFKELGEKRVAKAVKSLEHVAALANPKSYTYDNRQKEVILNALTNAMQNVKDSFDGKAKKNAASLGL
jgi:hypothetical protein